MLTLTENNIVVPNAELLIIPAFKLIWDKDTSKSKDTALKLFAYIYFKNDLKSSYRASYSGEELINAVKRDLFEDVKYKIPAYVSEAEEIYISTRTTKSLKLLIAVEAALEKVTDYFNDFNLNDETSDKDKSEMINKLMNNLKQVDEVTLKIETARKRVEAEAIATSMSNKRTLSKWETPK